MSEGAPDGVPDGAPDGVPDGVLDGVPDGVLDGVLEPVPLEKQLSGNFFGGPGFHPPPSAQYRMSR